MTKAMLNLNMLAMAAAFAGSALAAEGASSTPLRPLSECLDPQHARGWAVVDSDELVVDAGRRKYLVRLFANCPDLHRARAIRFRAAGGSSRLCGFGNEAVLPETNSSVATSCPIASIVPIDAARYDVLTGDAPETAPASTQ